MTASAKRTFDVEATVGELALAAAVTPRVPVGRVGPNGSSKTTLLHLALGVRRPSRGRVALVARTLYDDAAQIEMPPEDRHLGYLPQHYALFSHLDASGNVEFALGSLARGDRRAKA